MGTSSVKPDLETMRRVEELLREQLIERGEDPSSLPPHDIARHMRCAVHPDGAMAYDWKGLPILDVLPEPRADGTVQWRFFTRDTPVQ